LLCYFEVVVVSSLVLNIYFQQIKRDLGQFASDKISLVAELDDRKVLWDCTQIHYKVVQVQGSVVYIVQ
jgi:hypothetical protein